MKQRIALWAALAGLALAGSARAEIIFGLTATNQIATFNSNSPGTLMSLSPAFTGLTSGDTLRGIDIRPSNGLLYGFATNGTTGRVYTINPVSGLAALVSTLTQPVTAGASGFGVDFNPVADRLRVISNVNQNLRIDVTTGATTVDGTPAYASGDPNTGVTPAIVATAYNNNVPGAAATALFNLDSATGYLTAGSNPNAGTQTSIALVNDFITTDAAFDISGSGVGYVVLDGFTLQTINTSTGALTSLGSVNSPFLLDIAAPVPEPGSMALLGGAAVGLVGWFRRRAKS